MIRPVNKATVIAYYERPENNPKGLPATHRIAEVLDISRQAVEKWPDPIPELTAYKIQVTTRGKLQVDATVYRRMREAKRKTA